MRDGGRCQRRLPARPRSNAQAAPSVHAAGEACLRLDGCPAVALRLQHQAGVSLSSVDTLVNIERNTLRSRKIFVRTNSHPI